MPPAYWTIGKTARYYALDAKDIAAIIVHFLKTYGRRLWGKKFLCETYLKEL